MLLQQLLLGYAIVAATVAGMRFYECAWALICNCSVYASGNCG